MRKKQCPYADQAAADSGLVREPRHAAPGRKKPGELHIGGSPLFHID